MADKVPEMHMELLLQEVEGLRPDDRRWVLESYAKRRPDLKPTGQRLIDDMMRQLDELHRLLSTEAALPEGEQCFCIAALKYFLKDTDLIGDDFHAAGLVDDALVVRAAMIKLEEARK